MKRKQHTRLKERRLAVKSRRLVLLAVGLLAVALLTVFAIRSARTRPSRSPTTAASTACESCPIGAITFAPTIPNSSSPPSPAPAGMVWIPGGEFSMGSTVESESLCGLPGITRDALPVHRVYVDGFWMDATEAAKARSAQQAIISVCDS